ncbi:RNA polymerase sigma-70 factor (ECF subfamily) [Ilumatobacter fluminis]|uniref:RNA polymerase sigma-70 factor (ECF subfamily) n=2 Tax=Ilumatobacter fluminis TaxID=467091 RepID=A0A4R7I4A4_9ACTN|nr:RNA polymerase sigma-70 factor (ECF subfamily) [Ilumatobacter fluminis]
MQTDAVVERVRSVYETDHARLWRSIYAFAGSRDVADEATAEAFAQALRRGDELRDVAAWVWRSAFAIARGELQRRRRANGEPAEVPSVDTVDGLGGLLRRLAALSEQDRELIVLCHVGGWKPGELATVLGEPAGRVRVRLHRATERAREILENDR